MNDDQVLRVKALEVALATETSGVRLRKSPDAPGTLVPDAQDVVASAQAYYAFLSQTTVGKGG
jgi:hypothetical protein